MAIKKKIYKTYTKRQKAQFEETEQASKPDIAGMMELSYWEFKTTTIIMLRALMYKSTQHARTDEQYKQTERNPREEPKRNV